MLELLRECPSFCVFINRMKLQSLLTWAIIGLSGAFLYQCMSKSENFQCCKGCPDCPCRGACKLGCPCRNCLFKRLQLAN